MAEPRSVAVGGIGYGPLATASDGFVDNQEGVLRQLSGVTSPQTFGATLASITVGQSGLDTLDSFGVSTIGQPLVQASSLNSTAAFGASSAVAELATSDLYSSELFGAQSVAIGIASVGLSSVEESGSASVTVVATQAGLATFEQIGSSSTNVTVSDMGVSADEAFGSSLARLSLDSHGFAEADVFGSGAAQINGVTRDQDLGLASSEVIGSSGLSSGISIGALDSTTTVGVSTTRVTAHTAGFDTVDEFGVATISQTVYIEQSSGVAASGVYGASVASLTASSTGLDHDAQIATQTIEVTLGTAGVASVTRYGASQAVSFVAVEQTSGVESSTQVGQHTTNVTASLTAHVDGDAVGESSLGIVLDCEGVRGYEYTRSFGTPTIGIVVNSAPLGSDEAFGVQAASLQVNAIGLGSDDTFGMSLASYDQVLTQVQSLRSRMQIGRSSIARGNAVEDYANDAPEVITKRRPLRFWPQKRVGSSSSGGAAAASAVAVTAEMVTHDLMVAEARALPKGRVVKDVPHVTTITVRGRLIEASAVETEKQPLMVTASRTCHSTQVHESSVIVRGERVFKVA